MTEFLTPTEAARCLRLKPKTLYNLMHRGALKRGVHWFKREGELGIRFDPEALEKWVREGGEKQGAEVRTAKGDIIRI